MIWESKRWKDELLGNAKLLRQLEKKRRTEGRAFQFERSIFLSAYIMRKLHEARKLSSAWEKREVTCIIYPLKGRVPDLMNWHRLSEFYDFDSGKSVPITAPEFCNLLIHSFVFMEAEGQGKSTEGILFASDRSRERGLWFVALKDVLPLLKECGRDYPSSARYVRHPKTGQWVVWSGNGEPPVEWSKSADLMSAEYASKQRKKTPL
jgi:hypothetical protein